MKPMHCGGRNQLAKRLAKTLEISISAAIDTCRGCSDPQRPEGIVVQNNRLSAKCLQCDEHVFPEHLDQMKSVNWRGAFKPLKT